MQEDRYSADVSHSTHSRMHCGSSRTLSQVLRGDTQHIGPGIRRTTGMKLGREALMDGVRWGALRNGYARNEIESK